MVMVREPSLVSATFLVIYGSPRKGALLEAAGAEPSGFPLPPRVASALVPCMSCQVSDIAATIWFSLWRQ